MRKYVLFFLFIIFAAKYGYDYLLSEGFQQYGDRENAQWTCTVTNILGDFYLTTSDYKLAQSLYSRVMKRCPKTPMDEKATFRYATCLEKTSSWTDAGVYYQKYVENFPHGKNARVAAEALDRINFSR